MKTINLKHIVIFSIYVFYGAFHAALDLFFCHGQAPPKSKKAKEVKAKPEEEKKEEPQAEKEEAPAENGEAKAEEVLHVCLTIMKFASCCYVLQQCSRRT